jgi:aminoglycoside 6'-N-acetyltransferase
MELRGDRIVLRPLTEADVDRIVELGADPEVERWWRGLTPEHVLEKARGQDEGVAVFAILVEDEVAGMIQYWEELDDEYRHAGIDLFLGAEHHGRGLGTDAVRTMARHLIVDRGHRRLTIDPAAHNERAIRCYEKAGFKRVGIMREYWLDAEGVWRDGLLLDLLATEITSLRL